MSVTKIGMASFAHMHAGSYASSIIGLPEAKIEAVWDDDPERGGNMARQFNTSFEPDLERFLASDIQGVIVCTENAKHKDVVLAAARAGKHVMCEKPLAVSMADAGAMIDGCKKAGVNLATAFPCRFSPAMTRLRSAAAEGKLGEIIAIAGTNRGSFPGGWFVEFDKSGGGAVIDHTVHVVDLMRWLTGHEVTQVYAEISSAMHHQHFDDCGSLTLEFDNGLFATLDTSWSRPKSFPYWGDVTMEVVGTDGLASMDMFNQKFVVHSDQTMRTRYDAWGSNIDTELVKGFIGMINGDWPEALATGEDGLRAVEVAIGAYMSFEQHLPVNLPLK